MSSSAGIGGAYGLLLPEFPLIAAIYGDLKIAVNRAIEKENAQNPGDMESAPEVLELRDRLIQAFAEDGIIIPASAHCCGRGPRLIAWRDARLLPMSGPRIWSIHKPLGLSAHGRILSKKRQLSFLGVDSITTRVTIARAGC